MPDFRPAWWLPGPHIQTVWGRLSRRRILVRFEREVVEMPDGDELVLDHLPGDGPCRFILLHGLEGSSYSVYIQGILSRIAARGLPATAINFRSCARDPRRVLKSIPNRRPRFYHSGETTDFEFVVRTLKAREPDRVLLAFGASLGGNVVLKWLGENPDQTLVRAAATISVPYDLGAGSRHLEHTIMGRLYVSSFLRSLRVKAAEVVRRFPELSSMIDADRVRRSRTFYEFDDAATGPLHGFTGAEDYYKRSSSIHFVKRIKTPTLCISALDDPFLPSEVLARLRREISPAIDLRITEAGGHVGFVSGRHPLSSRYWAEEVIVDWLIAHGMSDEHGANAGGD